MPRAKILSKKAARAIVRTANPSGTVCSAVRDRILIATFLQPPHIYPYRRTPIYSLTSPQPPEEKLSRGKPASNGFVKVAIEEAGTRLKRRHGGVGFDIVLFNLHLGRPPEI